MTLSLYLIPTACMADKVIILCLLYFSIPIVFFIYIYLEDRQVGCAVCDPRSTRWCLHVYP